MSVFGILGRFITFLRVCTNAPVIDNAIFRLHYRFTAVIFFAACVLVGATDFFGKPITCMLDLPDKVRKPIETLCWITSTFTVPQTDDQPYPGVGPESSTGERRVHSYYQWVPFVLFFQGLLFYTPHRIWKWHEDGIVARLTDGIRGFRLNGGWKTQPAALSAYLHETMGSRGHLGVAQVLCELLNLLNAIGNIYFIDAFLGGTFFQYGVQVLQFMANDQNERYDPMIDAFPRMTKCTFEVYGPSGTLGRHDVLCLLPHNILNEKIYIFLWFWLLFLSIASAMALIIRMIVIASPAIRRMTISRFAPEADPMSLDTISKRASYSDYCLLTLLGRNLVSFSCHELIDDLAQRLDGSFLDSVCQ